MEFIDIATSTPTGLLAFAGSAFQQVGITGLLILAAGTPFAFYLIKRIIGIVPKGK